MATWFKRQNGHIFDISLHGFPYGMIKSCRKYWTREIADSIVQLKGVRFENPQFSLQTTFDRQDRPRTVRRVLPRPGRRRPLAYGAHHLRQRLDPRRPGDHLRHRLLELHAE